MWNVRRGSWRCGRGSIAEAVAEAVNNFLSTRKGKKPKLNCVYIRHCPTHLYWQYNQPFTRIPFLTKPYGYNVLKGFWKYTAPSLETNRHWHFFSTKKIFGKIPRNRAEKIIRETNFRGEFHHHHFRHLFVPNLRAQGRSGTRALAWGLTDLAPLRLSGVDWLWKAGITLLEYPLVAQADACYKGLGGWWLTRYCWWQSGINSPVEVGVVYPIIFNAIIHPNGGCLGFQSSTVVIEATCT